MFNELEKKNEEEDEEEDSERTHFSNAELKTTPGSGDECGDRNRLLLAFPSISTIFIVHCSTFIMIQICAIQF